VGDYDRMGDGIVALMKLGAILLVIFIPLGLWKLIDLLIWLAGHVRLGWE
jgi:hypothetical protein